MAERGADNRSFHNKAAEVLARVKSGQVVPKRDISHCEGALVHLTDGSSVVADYIVTCSGYRTSFPYFDPSVGPGTDPRKWFKYIFYDADPSLAFIGFVRPVFGSIPGISELQSRYVAKVFSGKCRLPAPTERAITTDADAKFWDHHFRFTSKRIAGLVDHYLYSDQLARLIGCYPNFRSLLLSSPSQWWRAMLAPWNGCQFWLNDVRHHDRIFETFRRYDDNRISQNYIFLALAPVLPLIGLNTQLRVAIGEWLVRRKNAVRDRDAAAESWWRPARGLAVGPSLAAEAAGSAPTMLARLFAAGPLPASTGSRAGSASADSASAWRSGRQQGDDAAPRAAASTAVIANIVEMLSGRLSREKATNYIDPQITIHMDSATHRGIELWQKWLYLIRGCGRLRQLRLVPSELSVDPQDPAIVNLVGRWVGVGRYDGVPREASHTSHFRYRLANNRVVELWTHKTNYDVILGRWIRYSVLYRLYLGWAIFLFLSLSRKGQSYHVDRAAGPLVTGGHRIKRSFWTKGAIVTFHVLFVANWWLPGAHLFGSLLVWLVLQLGVHLGYHRYFAHASFKTYPAFELLIACIGCLAFQNGPLWWASKHRHHHRMSDTDTDHHSPNRGFWHAHIGWLLRKEVDNIDWKLIPDLYRPIPLWVERNQHALHLLYVSSVGLIFGWFALLSFWIVPIVLCWHTTFATNSICHLFGSQPFASRHRGSCSARNNAIVAIMNLGEGWHNNHHAYPSRSHHGFYRWYQLDLVYVVLLLLVKVRVIWALK